MSQGLCSPWQADYRECGCFYWAASRPDFVNTTPNASGNIRGHDWMQKKREDSVPYRPDPGGRTTGVRHITYDDLYTDWQAQLKFILGGEDRE
jgi:hypothetical protein